VKKAKGALPISRGGLEGPLLRPAGEGTGGGWGPIFRLSLPLLASNPRNGAKGGPCGIRNIPQGGQVKG
jgi:hypothetical protein